MGTTRANPAGAPRYGTRISANFSLAASTLCRHCVSKPAENCPERVAKSPLDRYHDDPVPPVVLDLGGLAYRFVGKDAHTAQLAAAREHRVHGAESDSIEMPIQRGNGDIEEPRVRCGFSGGLATCGPASRQTAGDEAIGKTVRATPQRWRMSSAWRGGTSG